MVPTPQDSTRVHDLLLLRSSVVPSAGEAIPAWVTQQSPSDLWVVVRRATATEGLVAVGVRGINRNQRWGGFASLTGIKKRLAPSQLSAHRTYSTRLAVPALAALSWLEEHLSDSELDWGPVGSVGFELATGQQVITATSDLDIALFAPMRFTRDFARDLWSIMSAAPAKIDVRVETPYCGFSLEEYAREETGQILVRLAESRQLATDPWSVSLMKDEG